MSKIAIFTDCHALYEPTKAVIDDILRKGITEIYSLGDNIGLGPNPKEVLTLLEENNVKCIAGNSEEYSIMGTKPYKLYFTEEKEKSQRWTKKQLTSHELEYIKTFKHSFDLAINHKKIALCHFANDVRFDFDFNSTWTFQQNHEDYIGYRQFYYTNSSVQMEELNTRIQMYGVKDPYNLGVLSALKDPLFKGKTIDYYDMVIMGHTHFEVLEETDRLYYAIQAVAMGVNDDNIDQASYITIDDNASIKKCLVPYDREQMVYNILKCPNKDSNIKKYTKIKI